MHAASRHRITARACSSSTLCTHHSNCQPLLPAVSEAQQSDPRLLGAVYDDMAAKFAEHGLNLPAVAAMQQYFENLEGEGEH